MNFKKKYINIIVKILVFLGLLLLNNPTIYSQESLEDAKVTLSFSDENDRKIITATATDNEGLPIEELELYFYVKRTFSLLPIGDGFNMTDENGIIEVEFPTDLPGDNIGNVDIIVQLTESEIYNELSLEKTLKWGVPSKLIESDEKRSLWAASANAPMSLVIITSLLIFVVYFIIFFILYLFYKISRITPVEN